MSGSRGQKDWSGGTRAASHIWDLAGMTGNGAQLGVITEVLSWSTCSMLAAGHSDLRGHWLSPVELSCENQVLLEVAWPFMT